MLLLVLCLALLQGTLQHPQNEGVPSHHGGITPTEYQTSFSCVGRVAGYYADIESGCQLYHLCDVDGRRFTHSCPNATLFQQRIMICDHWYMVNCNTSIHDYNANLLIGQRDKPFVGSDHNHHREPVNFLTVSHNPGSLQHPNWFPTIARRPEHAPEDNDNAVPSPSPQVSSIHFTYTPPPPLPSSANVGPSASSQRETRYGNFNGHNDNSGHSIPQTSTPKEQREKEKVVRPLTSISQYRETGSESSQRKARYRDFNVGHDNSRQTIPRTFTSRSEDQRVVVNTPVPSFSQYHEKGSEGRLPDAYTNNPFFQHLINRPTPELLSTIKEHVNPQLTLTKISQQKGPKAINQQAKLEDIANVRVSNSQTPTPRRVEEASIHLDNSGVQNFSPSARNQKLADFSNNPFFQSVTKTRSQEVPAITTPRSATSNSSNRKFSIGENEEDLNNIVELHILDPRKMFYISESKNHEIAERNSTVLFISLPRPLHNNSHGFMNFRSNVKSLEGTNPQCPRCHPAFLSPGKCQPCVIIR